MNNHSTLKRITNCILAVVSAVGACASPTIASAYVPPESYEMLVPIDCSTGDMAPWNVLPCSEDGSDLKASVVNEQLQIEIVNNGGLDDGGEDIWDRALRYGGILQFHEDNTYRVEYSIEASNAGKFYTYIGSESGDIELWHNNVGHADTENFKNSYQCIEIPANQKMHFVSDFVCDENYYPQWAFFFGGAGEQFTEDCFPDGTILTFDDFSLYCNPTTPLPAETSSSDGIIPCWTMESNELIFDPEFWRSTTAPWYLSGYGNQDMSLHTSPIYEMMEVQWANPLGDGVTDDLSDFCLTYPDLPILKGKTYDIDMYLTSQVAGTISVELLDPETDTILWQGKDAENDDLNIPVNIDEEFAVKGSFTSPVNALHADLKIMLNNLDFSTAYKAFILEYVSIQCKDKAWMPLESENVVAASFFEYSSVAPWIYKGENYLFTQTLGNDELQLEIRDMGASGYIEDATFFLENIPLKKGRTYQVEGVVIADNDGVMLTDILDESATNVFWHDGYSSEDPENGSHWRMNLQKGVPVSLNSTFVASENCDAATWEFLFGGKGTGDGFPDDTKLTFRELRIVDITDQPEDKTIGSEITIDGDKMMIGDITNDNKVSIADAVLLSRFANEELLSEERTQRILLVGDVDADGSYTMNDVSKLLRYIARLE